MSSNYRKILKILSKKRALPSKKLSESNEKKEQYALSRSIKGMIEKGYIEEVKSDNQVYLKITAEGKQKLNCMDLEGQDSLVPQSWDGKWRIIILDLPEDRKSERESLRYLLKKANFTCIKNAVWVSPHPYEHLFTNIKNDLGLTTELMIIVTGEIDPQTSLAFLGAIKD